MRLELPLLQNWSCHNCGGCCRQHLIEVTDAERARILAQQWTPADGIPAGQPVLEWHSGPPWKKRYRLAHQPDGACVFLNDQGLCRIHAKFGEDAKPLPCRIYPYTFHPAGEKLTVSLRFSCPSVTGNRGRSVVQQRTELVELAQAAVPRGAEQLPPPRLSPGEQLDWPEFHRFVKALDESFRDESVPLLIRLLRILTWTGLAAESRFAGLPASRLTETLSLMRQAAAIAHPRVPVPEQPSYPARRNFRVLAAAYVRQDTVEQLSAGLRGRYRLLRVILRFLSGAGDLPAMQTDLPSVPFQALETPLLHMSRETEELFVRYFQVKTEGLHFCGRGFYNLSFTEGVANLVLVFPLTLWVARWIAVGRGETHPSTGDIARALNIVDHNHGFSGLLGQRQMQTRVRQLMDTGELATLCVWYAFPRAAVVPA